MPFMKLSTLYSDDPDFLRQILLWNTLKWLKLSMIYNHRVDYRSQQIASLNYRHDIDGLRAIAVLSVIGYHTFPDWIKGGFIGVDIFFVVSGFLISTMIFDNLNRDTFSLITFYCRRIRRIFPALILVLLVSYLIGWLSLLAPEFKQLGKHIAGGAGFVSNILMWNESGYFDTVAESKPLLHLWSLGVEEQFYIIWPLLLCLIWRLGFNILIFAVTLGIISFILGIKGVSTDAVAAFYSVQTRFWELLAGAILAYFTYFQSVLSDSSGKKLELLLEKNAFAKIKGCTAKYFCDVQSILGISLLIAGLCVVTKESKFPGWLALLPTIGTVFIISAGSGAWLNRAVLSNRLLVWFGLISYPLYLWHWPMLSFSHVLDINDTHIIRIGAIILAIVLAWLTFHFLEKPVRYGQYSKGKTVALTTLMIAVGVAGYICYKNDGFSGRFPDIINKISKYRYDFKKEYRYGTCFLAPEQGYEDFDLCKTTIESDKETIVLWGDSHAAHLYPGYRENFGNEYNIIQRTASLCPPILGMEIPSRPNCKEINDHTYDLIKKQQPKILILAALWSHYDWRKINATIMNLEKEGFKNVYLIGPVPRWNERLPRLLYLYFKSDIFKRIPERMNYGLNQDIVFLDRDIASFSAQYGINYISPYNIFCDDNGCLTKLDQDNLTTWDYGHLTGPGSRYLVSKFPFHKNDQRP